MTATKSKYLSKGVWGGVLVMLISATGLAIQFDPATGDFSGNLYSVAEQVATLAAGALALWGRFSAKTVLK